MLREETAKLLMMIQGAYPNYKPDNKTVTINTWNLALSDISFDLAQKAFLAYLRADTKGFAPTPGQLIALRMDQYLFCNENGDPISRERIQGEIDRIIKRIKSDGYDFPRITSHVFRHTFATRAIEAGMPPQVLKTILGHSSLAMTMDLYSHVLPDTKADEMQKIANVF